MKSSGWVIPFVNEWRWVESVNSGRNGIRGAWQSFEPSAFSVPGRSSTREDPPLRPTCPYYSPPPPSFSSRRSSGSLASFAAITFDLGAPWKCCAASASRIFQFYGIFLKREREREIGMNIFFFFLFLIILFIFFLLTMFLSYDRTVEKDSSVDFFPVLF